MEKLEIIAKLREARDICDKLELELERKADIGISWNLEEASSRIDEVINYLQENE